MMWNSFVPRADACIDQTAIFIATHITKHIIGMLPYCHVLIKCRVVIFMATDILTGDFSGGLTAAVIKCRVVIFMATLIIYGIIFSGRLTAAVLKCWGLLLRLSF